MAAWIKFAGIALIALGLLTIVRGVPAVHEWVHETLMPAGHEGSGHAGH
jgi:hypothetical protein